jgi:hypothetical protein
MITISWSSYALILNCHGKNYSLAINVDSLLKRPLLLTSPVVAVAVFLMMQLLSNLCTHGLASGYGHGSTHLAPRIWMLGGKAYISSLPPTSISLASNISVHGYGPHTKNGIGSMTHSWRSFTDGHLLVG